MFRQGLLFALAALVLCLNFRMDLRQYAMLDEDSVEFTSEDTKQRRTLQIEGEIELTDADLEEEGELEAEADSRPIPETEEESRVVVAPPPLAKQATENSPILDEIGTKAHETENQEGKASFTNQTKKALKKWRKKRPNRQPINEKVPSKQEKEEETEDANAGTTAEPDDEDSAASTTRNPPIQTELESGNTPNMTKDWWKTLSKKQQKHYNKLSEKDKELWRREKKQPEKDIAAAEEEEAGETTEATTSVAEEAEITTNEAAATELKDQNATENSTEIETGSGETGEDRETVQEGNSSSSVRRSWRPTEEWLKSCAAELADDQTIRRPYYTKRDGYGLGDCIKMCARCTLGKINRRDKNLAFQYRSKACYMNHPRYVSGGNLDVVEELLRGYKKKHNPPEPPEDAIVLHLRVGDVIEKSKQNTETLLIKGGDPYHTAEFKNSIKSTYEYLDNVEESGATSVVVVGGVFQKKHFKRSRVYEGCLERAFRTAGYNVTMSMDSGEADQDFYYMTKSKKFVLSSGGFSSLIAKLVVRNGGEIIGRTFDDPEAVAKYERQMIRKTNNMYKKKKH